MTEGMSEAHREKTEEKGKQSALVLLNKIN